MASSSFFARSGEVERKQFLNGPKELVHETEYKNREFISTHFNMLNIRTYIDHYNMRAAYTNKYYL